MIGTYIIISIIVLAIIVTLAIYTGKSKIPNKLSKLAIFAMLLIVLGIISISTGQGCLISYSFMGVAILLSVADIINNLKNR